MPLTPEETRIEDEDENSAPLSRVAAAKDYLAGRPLLALAVAVGAGLLIARMLF